MSVDEMMIRGNMRTDKIYASAAISYDKRYRYLLSRIWGNARGSRICWVLLNPSTADHVTDDMTIRKIMRFSKKWGHHALDVVNLFALRSRFPSDLHGPVPPVGPDNDEWIKYAVGSANRIVCAWGKTGRFLDRERQVLKLLGELERKHKPPILTLALNLDGTPRHPLYLQDATQPQLWVNRIGYAS